MMLTLLIYYSDDDDYHHLDNLFPYDYDDDDYDDDDDVYFQLMIEILAVYWLMENEIHS